MSESLQPPEDSPERRRNPLRCIVDWARRRLLGTVAAAEQETPASEPPAPQRAPTIQKSTDETLRKRNPREDVRLLLRYLRARFGDAPNPDMSMRDVIRDVLDTDVRIFLEKLTHASDIQTMGDLLEVLMPIAGESRGMIDVLAKIDETYPDGIPEKLPARAILQFFSPEIRKEIWETFVLYEFVFMREVVDHLRMIERRRKE